MLKVGDRVMCNRYITPEDNKRYGGAFPGTIVKIDKDFHWSTPIYKSSPAYWVRADNGSGDYIMRRDEIEALDAKPKLKLYAVLTMAEFPNETKLVASIVTSTTEEGAIRISEIRGREWQPNADSISVSVSDEYESVGVTWAKDHLEELTK